eukprot:5615936-Prymnesium_polylepis.1
MHRPSVEQDDIRQDGDDGLHSATAMPAWKTGEHTLADAVQTERALKLEALQERTEGIVARPGGGPCASGLGPAVARDRFAYGLIQHMILGVENVLQARRKGAPGQLRWQARQGRDVRIRGGRPRAGRAHPA